MFNRHATNSLDKFGLLFSCMHTFLKEKVPPKYLEIYMRIYMYFAEANFYEIYEKSMTGTPCYLWYDGYPVHEHLSYCLKFENENWILMLPHWQKWYPLEYSSILSTIIQLESKSMSELKDYCKTDMPIQVWRHEKQYISPINWEYVFYRDDEHSIRFYPICCDCKYEYHGCHFKGLNKLREYVTKCNAFEEE